MHRGAFRATTALTIVALMTLVLAAPTFAAAPSNDTHAGSVAVSSIPFTASLNTTEATTDADDAEANAACGAPATDASVWYSITPGSDTDLVVDVGASDYSAGVIVVSGSPGSFALVTCGPGAVAFTALSGETYSILAFDDQQDGAGTGGTLNITIDLVPPPPSIDELTIDHVAHFTKAGSAIVSGTVVCNGQADFSTLDVELRQRVGRIYITGFGETSFPCDGSAYHWSVEVFADNGLFKGGKAATVSVAFACGPFFCGDGFAESRVQLKR